MKDSTYIFACPICNSEQKSEHMNANLMCIDCGQLMTLDADTTNQLVTISLPPKSEWILRPDPTLFGSSKAKSQRRQPV